jgi:predicted RNA-binding Zn-ribbon protein involved in translation (DUF1610 family)
LGGRIKGFYLQKENTMNDFITMQCPNCGGNLAVGTNALSLKCEHCGIEHMIRREASGVVLESYARCPVCNRNDKAEKVSAILRSQTQNSEGITYQTQTVMVQVGKGTVPVNKQVAVPVKTSQISELAKHLALPSRPQFEGNPEIKDGTSHTALISAIIVAVVAIVGFLCTGVLALGLLVGSSNGTADSIITILLVGFLSIVPLSISILLFVFVVPRQRRSNMEKRVVAEYRRREFQIESAEQEKRWQMAVDRWNKLYYCGRDDCVFLPGTNKCAPITDMTKYLFQP